MTKRAFDTRRTCNVAQLGSHLVRKNVLVKVLGGGKLTAKVDVTAHKFSSSAREAITAAGGTANEL